MKSLFQIFLVVIMITVAFFFYKKYFVVKEAEKIISPKINEDIGSKDIENIIEKFKYEVQLIDNGNFEINAKSSTIINIDNIEIISMNNVEAIIIDNKDRRIEIKSNEANFNTESNDVSFFGNVKVDYLKNLILSNKLDFDYEYNTITIYENIVYKGNYGTIKADNIKIDLTNKNMKIYMDNQNDKVKIINNN